MKRLHIVNRSSRNSSALDDCLRAASPGDGLILIEQGVYCITELSEQQRKSIEHLGLDTFSLEADRQARGIQDEGMFESVDDAGFVALVIDYPSSLSWN